MMTRNTLAVPASGCSVEQMFNVSGRVATWQRSRLRDATIADIVMYKAAINMKESALEMEEWDDFPVEEVIGQIPAMEWE
jgi:hypothetical protein